jgi:hypothetical protein
MNVIETFTLSAKGGLTEDLIVETPHYFGVFDGVTGVKDWMQDGKTMGQWGSWLAGEALKELPPGASAKDFAMRATEKIADKRKAFGLGPADRLASTAIILPRRRPLEVWSICDSHFGYKLKGGEWRSLPQTKPYDEVTLAFRHLVLTQEILAHGLPKTKEDRAALAKAAWACIVPAIEKQVLMTNHPDPREKLGFCMLTGALLPAHGIVIHPLPDDTAEVVLCTDGFPEAFPTAAEGRACLDKLRAEDPFLSGKNPLGFMGHKGGFVQMDGTIAECYDDVAYLRIAV